MSVKWKNNDGHEHSCLVNMIHESTVWLTWVWPMQAVVLVVRVVIHAGSYLILVNSDALYASSCLMCVIGDSFSQESSPSFIFVHTFTSVYNTLIIHECVVRAEELCESRGGHPGLTVPTGPCGRKATWMCQAGTVGDNWKIFCCCPLSLSKPNMIVVVFCPLSVSKPSVIVVFFPPLSVSKPNMIIVFFPSFSVQCLFSALSRRVGALQISVIIISVSKPNVIVVPPPPPFSFHPKVIVMFFYPFSVQAQSDCHVCFFTLFQCPSATRLSCFLSSFNVQT